MLPRVFIGVDLTDAFAVQPRPVDIAILHLNEQGEFGNIIFQRINWVQDDPATRPTIMAATIANVCPNEAKVYIFDGPQGLAIPQNNTRQVERKLGAPAHTPWQLPEVGSRPFAGYIRSSVLLFDRIVGEHGNNMQLADLNKVDPKSSNVFEAYPGAEWPLLANNNLSPKATQAGRRQRFALLQDLGIGLNLANLTHDQMDAALCSILGAFYFYPRPELEPQVAMIGEIPVYQGDGSLREGRMLHFDTTGSS